MKKAAIIITGVILYFGVFAQVPQGFNYQAVVRNDQGAPLAEQQVSIRLTLQDEAGKAIHYSETHSVITSPQGVVNFVVGGGTVQSGAFADIPWTEGNIHMKIEVDPTGGNSYTTLGVSQLQSVPYALHAQTANRFEAIPGNEDQALFEVRNSEGKVVFAVYEQGVRIYVDGDPADEGKGNRSGFAIGGLTGFKDTGEEYFRVSRGYTQVLFDDQDKGNRSGFAIGGLTGLKAGEEEKDYLSVSRARTQVLFDDQNKGNRSGFAIGGLTGLKEGEDLGSNFFDVTTDATGIIDPAENRVLWYPLKNAFMAGRVLIPSPYYVGTNSFAVGYESMGQGEYSQAMGYQAEALAIYSTAIGKKAKAFQANSFAFGEDAQAQGEESYAIGRGALAQGIRSFAFGSVGVDSAGVYTENTQALGNYSFAMGQGAKAGNWGSFAIGVDAEALGYYSVAMGYKTQASDYYATAFGSNTEASGFSSTAMGRSTVASGSQSTAMGYNTLASGELSTAMGKNSEASGFVSTAIGDNAKASGMYSTAMGTNTIASGKYSTALGNATEASEEYSTALGIYSQAVGRASTAMGGYTVASGITSTALGHATEASGVYSTSMGSNTKAYGDYSTAMGYLSTASANNSTAMGVGTIANTYGMIAIGSNNLTGDDNFETWTDTDPMFVVGVGNSLSNKRNAMTVLKNGRIGLQSITAPTHALELPNSAVGGEGSALATAWHTYSDLRLDSDPEPIQYGLAEVMSLVPKTYLHHNSTIENGSIVIASWGKQDIGLVAQEVYDIIPEVVSKPSNEQAALWGLAYDKLVPVLVKAIQEQQDVIEGLKQKTEELSQKNEEIDILKAEIELLKQLIVK